MQEKKQDNTDQISTTSDRQLTLKKDHTHQRVLYKKGEKLETLNPDPDTIAYLKQHHIV